MLQSLDPKGLEHVVMSPDPQGFDRRLQGAVGGQHDQNGVRRPRRRLPQEFDSAAAGHPKIGQEDVDGPFANLGQSLVGRRALRDLVAALAKGFGDRDAEIPLVVCQQDSGHVSRPLRRAEAGA